DHFGLVRTGTADLTGSAVQERGRPPGEPGSCEAVPGGPRSGRPVRADPLIFSRGSRLSPQPRIDDAVPDGLVDNARRLIFRTGRRRVAVPRSVPVTRNDPEYGSGAGPLAGNGATVSACRATCYSGCSELGVS